MRPIQAFGEALVGSGASHSPRAEESLAPGPATRLLARVRSRPLDRALIEGVDPASSSRLAARAAQLTARTARDELAGGLERLVRVARQPPSRQPVRLRRTPVLVHAPLPHEI